jgi:hypothetical protein
LAAQTGCWICLEIRARADRPRALRPRLPPPRCAHPTAECFEENIRELEEYAREELWDEPDEPEEPAEDVPEPFSILALMRDL